MAYNRIFLSHKGLDKTIVRQYRDALEAIGFRPWMDESDMTKGAPLVRALSEGMANSSAAVFFVTPLYEDHGYLRAEIDDALAQQVVRGNGFRIITLALRDEAGVRGKVPDPLRKFVWGEPNTHLEGLRFIIEALPSYLSKVKGYLPLQELVPPTAKEVALIGQNLSSRLGLDNRGYATFLRELNELLARSSMGFLALIMMTPSALLAVHPEAAADLRHFTLPRLKELGKDVKERDRCAVVFHPAATLSALAVDWTRADKSFALITPKFQRTVGIHDRISILLDEQHFDASSLARMLYDADRGGNGSYKSSLEEASSLLERLLFEAGL